MSKPIRIFFSPLSRRFYATRAWKEISPGVVECTGEKFDVTNEIADLIRHHSITFELRDPEDPQGTHFIRTEKKPCEAEPNVRK